MPRSAVPVLAHRQIGGLGALAARVDGRVLEHEQQVGQLAGGAAIAQRPLQLEGLRVGDRSELRDPELGHGPKATLRPVSDHERALLARPHALAPARGVDVAVVRGDHAARRRAAAQAAAGARGHRPDPRHPARDVRQPGPGRRGRPLAGAPHLEAPAGRRPGRARRRRSSRCSPTGSARACWWRACSASSPPGWPPRPTIVVETEQREQAAEDLNDYVDAHGDDELRRNLEASDTARARRRLLPQLHPARRPRALDLLLHRRQEQATHARSATPASCRTSATPRGQRASRPPGRTSNSSTRLRPRRSAVSGTISEKYSVAPAAQVEAAPDRPDAAVDGHREVAQRAGRRRPPAGRSRGSAGSASRARRRRAAPRWPARRAPGSRRRPRRSARRGRAARGAARSGTRTPTGRRTAAALCAPVPNLPARQRAQRLARAARTPRGRSRPRG